MKTLVVAEKPSVGKDIAHALKCGRKGDGFLYNDAYVISWAIGHLVTLYEPEDYDASLKRWDKRALPIKPDKIKLKPIAKTRSQLNVLKKLMNSSEIDNIVCATDSGREGELIFRYIYEIVGCKRPVRRLWISSMTEAAIMDGFANLKSGAEYDSLYDSAKCRSEADWLVGMNASRAFTLKYNVLLSIGRVQTPTLAIITERQKEINAFIPKDFWEVRATLCKFAQEETAVSYMGTWFDQKTEDTKLFDRARADEIAARTAHCHGVVESVESERKRVPPPKLYDLTELQRDSNRRFGFTAAQTLQAAQNLYEKYKLITYPRTDSRVISTDMVSKISPILEKINVEPLSRFVARLLALDKLPITKRIVDDSKVSDHHAIIPTPKIPNISSLPTNDAKVYDLVARRFVAVFYPPHVYDEVKVITAVGEDKFITKGKIEIDPGWTELYANNADDDEESVPKVERGDAVVAQSVDVLSKKTQPPKPFNDATLLSAMENAGRFVDNEELQEQLKESGLGTPATRAAIIERLLTVGYIIRKGKNLAPTEKGMKLIDAVPKELRSPEMTGKWEKGLGAIARAGMSPGRFMASINRYVDYLVKYADETPSNIVFPAAERPPAHRRGLRRGVGAKASSKRSSDIKS
ncbi:MAG: DNA topoisomerase III [Clostridiales bacterium]|nr:DNA topoisomerase III [Clostridiales bacterium]